MKPSIDTLNQLDKEIETLHSQIRLTKSEFIESVGRSKSKSKNFLLKKVALPAGTLGLAGLAFNTLMSNNGDIDQQNEHQSNTKNDHPLLALIPVLVPLLRTFLSK